MSPQLLLLATHLVWGSLGQALGDPCTNLCEEGNPAAWCGARRADASGRVARCTEGTKDGEVCVDGCSTKGEDYFWCWTNANVDTVGDYWNKCGPNDGVTAHTVKGVACRGACGLQGETYWWCRDDDMDPSSWDYCSPPGQVRPVEYTRHGHACRGECGQHGENYWWCTKSLRWGATDNQAEDDWWEYCSPSRLTTRYNLPCKEPCASRGESYFWCPTSSSWDYCSPEASSVEEIITRDNYTCNGVCDKMSSSYYFCEHKMVRGGLLSDASWWDYCTPHGGVRAGGAQAVLASYLLLAISLL